MVVHWVLLWASHIADVENGGFGFVSSLVQAQAEISNRTKNFFISSVSFSDSDNLEAGKVVLTTIKVKITQEVWKVSL